MDNELKYRLTLQDYFKKTMLGAVNDTKKLDTGMNKLNSTINKVGVGMATYFGGAAVARFGSAVLDSLKNYEYFSTSIRTLMYGDKAAAKALEGQLVKLAATSPFNLTDVQESSKQLLAYDFAAGSIVQNMKMLGDVSSGVGAPLTDIVYLYGTLKTQGRAYTKDIMQFTSRGIPIIRELAKQFGVTEGEVQKLVEAGKVGFPQVERAFQNMTSSGGQFFNMMNEQSKTVGGQLSNLADTWEQLKVSIGKSQTGIIASTTNWASQFVSKLQMVIENSNKMDEAFSKFGAKNYSWIESFNNTLFAGSTNSTINSLFTGGKGKTEMLQRSLENMYVKPSQGSEMSGFTSKRQLAEFASNYIQAYRDDLQKEKLGFGRKISTDEYQRGLALIKQAQEQIDGNLKLFKAKVNTEAAKEGVVEKALKQATTPKAEKTALGTATEVNGARPQNINIQLERLGDITIQTTNVTESAEKTREVFTKQLLEVLNDANLIASR